ncbi:MAG: hypothetical protein LBE81_05445 [Azonexus sp.]|jgi:hypothetical protein|uniref:hypothetical protein n=1 Tax=Azonexus sp. TaxID=1872668 RepID=UPI002828A1CC|nr:hypothetical protein [Azonexus sp.]MDR0776065.1 hypothetical protein [Azonexus sp.]
MKPSRLVIVLLIGILLYQCGRDRPIHSGAGVIAPETPVQVETREATFDYKGFSIQPLADFSIEARVLASERYRFDTGAALAPIDLVLGWGRMSDTDVLKHFNISQGGRWYHWHADSLPIPANEVAQSSANMHMIPANDSIDRKLRAVRVGQVVHIHGWLVEARHPNGWRWRSSLTRDDSGAGACELIFVRELEIR